MQTTILYMLVIYKEGSIFTYEPQLFVTKEEAEEALEYSKKWYTEKEIKIEEVSI